MDYASPIRALLPGVSGRVLDVLSGTQAELSMRQVAERAAASQTQVAEVLGRLVELGVVGRRDVGRSALVRLDRANAAAQVIETLADLRVSVMARMGDEAKRLDPAPASLVVFGSFATGNAGADSDVDVLAVRAHGVDADDDHWITTLGAWADTVAHLAGNPVNLLDVGVDDLRSGPPMDQTLWGAILAEGIVLVGSDLHELSHGG